MIPEAKILQLEADLVHERTVNSSLIHKIKELEKEVEELQKTIDFVEGEVAKVYCHITGGKLSKANYYAQGVISEADQYYQDFTDEELEAKDKEIAELQKTVAVMREALKLARPHVAFLIARNPQHEEPHKAIQAIDEALSLSPSQLDEDLGKVREALEKISIFDSKTISWANESVRMAKLAKEALAILEKWSGK